MSKIRAKSIRHSKENNKKRPLYVEIAVDTGFIELICCLWLLLFILAAVSSWKKPILWSQNSSQTKINSKSFVQRIYRETRRSHGFENQSLQIKKQSSFKEISVSSSLVAVDVFTNLSDSVVHKLDEIQSFKLTVNFEFLAFTAVTFWKTLQRLSLSLP